MDTRLFKVGDRVVYDYGGWTDFEDGYGKREKEHGTVIGFDNTWVKIKFDRGFNDGVQPANLHLTHAASPCGGCDGHALPNDYLCESCRKEN